ncbi:MULTISPECIES: isochorismatase family protein [Desulfosporosinus]|uniref:Peroxyureidoacrylate/ureidoacrylate amidohydrolase RutB n=1 Tax=Desulfosporosinus acididurans TaxID=476652 RepID=A0A0J1IRV5_9FIRM|nr:MULTISPECIES: isochorismatase family protein [Desulfosporosinus]KLU67401.1 peroxyureidoacrylate/ureidoacrylate amidohydrolase RutB [Desulfosporosinus acididurans]
MEKYCLNGEEAVLMAIDIQERLVPSMKYGEKVIQNTNILISIMKKIGAPIIATEQYPKGLGKTVSDVSSNLEGSLTIEKSTFSGFTSEVTSALQGIGRKKIIITGMETHVCVFQTVRDLLSQGYQVFVASDAVCSRTKENYRNGLSLMSEMGAVISNTETLLFDILKQSGTPLFKELSKLIK